MQQANVISLERRRTLPVAWLLRRRRILRHYTVAMALAISAVLGLVAAGPPALADDSAAHAVSMVNINTADARELAAGLKGVGQSRAEAIVRYREAYGPFASVDELAEVKGIGQSTLDMNRKRITLE